MRGVGRIGGGGRGAVAVHDAVVQSRAMARKRAESERALAALVAGPSVVVLTEALGTGN